MKTVSIIGKIDIENFGDLLLARLFVDWIKPHNLRVICPGVPQDIVQQIGAHDSGSFSESDLFLYIGGGYFGEQPGTLRQKIRWGNSKLKATILPGLVGALKQKPIAVVGPGFGPLTNIATRIASLVLISRAKIRSLRDSESIGYYKRYGGGQDIVETADCALTLAESPLSQEAESAKHQWLELAGNKKLIGVHLIKQAMDLPGGDAILDQVKRLMQNADYKIVLFDDQRGTSGARETVALYRQTFGNSCEIMEYSTIDKLIGFLEACNLVVTTKLHVGIVSVARSTPVLSFPFHTKTQRFYNQIGRPDLCLPFDNWSAQSIQEKFEKVPELVQTRITLPADLVNRAKLNQTLVEKFIKPYAINN